MKIISANQTKAADHFSMIHEPIDSIDLMERASEAFVHNFIQKYPTYSTVAVFCGPGNNGGDGLAIARLLNGQEYFVTVFIFQGPKSDDFTINLERYQKLQKVHIINDSFDEELNYDIIIDAIFGYGLNRKVSGIFEKVINKLNLCNSIRVSVDIPSGMSADRGILGVVFMADLCITFQLPKLSFFLSQSQDAVRELEVVDIQLNSEFLEEEKSIYFTVEGDYVERRIKKRNKSSHKGSYGHILICGGSKGMMGAMVLSSKAALRSGAGLVSCCIPGRGLDIMQTAVPEVMVIPDEEQDMLSHIPNLAKFNAIGVGPGMGTSVKTVKFLENLMNNATGTLILDADALNILSENRELLELIPKNSILTPHPGEFKRLVGVWKDDLEKHKMQSDFAKKYNCIVVLKGHYTSVADPSGFISFNMSGNPGMATAGSGDTLTGIISGLCGQGYQVEEAARIGVYLHGLAGDLATEIIGQYSLIASDIIDFLPKAWIKITKKKIASDQPT